MTGDRMRNFIAHPEQRYFRVRSWIESEIQP